MSKLEAMGIQVQHDVADGATHFAFTLPQPTKVEATFSKEGMTDRLAKIFSREIQTGDEEFDAAVYIKTDTVDETKALLASEAARSVIGRIVDGGGAIELEGAFVKVELAGEQPVEHADIVTLAGVLLGKA